MIYRIIIVEDEPPSMRRIERCIQQSGIKNIAVVGKAANGVEALELIEKTNPHIILSDVRMPVMDGFALVEKVRLQYPQIRIAMLSGYQDFDYVRKALQYQLTDYLLKPLNPEDLKAVLCKMILSLIQSSHQAVERYLKECIAHHTSSCPLPEELKYYHVFLFNQGFFYNSSFPYQLIHSIEKERCLLPGAITTQADDHWCLGCGAPNQMLYVLAFAGENSFIPENAAQLLGENALRQQVTIAGYLCAPSTHLGEAVNSCRRWMEAAVIPQRGQFLDASLPLSRLSSPVLTKGDEKNLFDALDQGDVSRFSRTLSAIMHQQLPQNCTQQAACGLMDSVLLSLKTYLFGLSDDRIQNLDLMLRELLLSCPPEALREEFVRRLRHFLISCDCLAPASSSVDQAVQQISRYLLEHYREPVELQNLACSFGISPTYLSTLFKKQYGMTPMKYLLNIRVERAKELIRSQPDIPLHEVAQLVGYDDPHYFSRIFRNTTGLAPSEFRSAAPNADPSKEDV